MANLWVNGSPGYEGQYSVRTNNIPTSPQDQLRQAADRAIGIRDARNKELTDLGSEFGSTDKRLGGELESTYRDMAQGGWGMSPEESANYLDLGGLETLDPAGRLDAYQSGADKVREASAGRLGAFQTAINPRADQDTEANVYDWLNRMDTQGFDILGSNSAEVKGILNSLTSPVTIGSGSSGGYGGYGAGWGGGAVSMGPVDFSGLKTSDRFKDFYMTPEQQQAMIQQASRTVGERYNTSRSQAIDAMRQAGVTNPIALAELERRFAADAGRGADAGILDARVGTDRERAGRLLAGEQLETDLSKTRAGLSADVARTNAQLADSAAGRSLQASLQAAAQQAENDRLAASLTAQNRQFAAGATADLGSRDINWLDNLSKTGIGWETSRDNEMNRRNEVLAREGYGGNVDVESGLLGGETTLRSNIADQGLQYSNAKSGRYGDLYSTNTGAKAAGVQGLQQLQSDARDDRMGTYGLRAANDQTGASTNVTASTNLFTGKNAEPKSFWEEVGSTALGLGAKYLSGMMG